MGEERREREATVIPGFWVGLPGDITAEQRTLLAGADLDVAGIHTSFSGREGAMTPAWSEVRISAADATAAREQVAQILTLDVRDLTVRPVDGPDAA
jgi:hypothetical protein